MDHMAAQTNGIFHKTTYSQVRMAHCIYKEVTFSKKYCIPFIEDRICFSKYCRP